MVVKVSKDGSPVAPVRCCQVDRFLGEAGVDLVIVLYLGIDVPLRMVKSLMRRAFKLWHEACTKHRPLWSRKISEGASRQVCEGVPSLLLLGRPRREKCSWDVVPESWTVVHRVALVHQRSAAVLVQRVELVVHPEALWCLVVASLPFAGDWCLVDLASIARAARDRAHLIFHITAAHTSLEKGQSTIKLTLNCLHAVSL